MKSFSLQIDTFYRPLLVGSLLVLSACGGGNNDPAQGGELANPVAPTSGDWQMIWEDSFDGDALDPANWEVQLGDGTAEGIPGWGNNELQYYAAENIRVSDGNLIIEARADSNTAPGFDFTSGRIRTQGKLDFTYGRIEASIQVPAGQGLWSAFWLLGSDPSIYGEWAAKGEIDIMEKFLPDFFTSAVHFGSIAPQNEFVSQAYDSIDPTDGFHTYAVEWDAERIRFFVDGENFYTVGADTYYNYYFKNSEEGFVEGGANAPFNENQHILLNMAVGGNLPGNPGDLSVFPAQMLVDYVRVYECPIDPATGLGCEDSIDPVNPFVTFEVAADAPVITRSALYDDALVPLFAGTDTERVIDFGVFDNSGALVLSEVARDTGGMAIDIRTSGGGNVSIVDPNGGTFRLVNMGSAEFPGSSADFKFDIKVISGADTNPDGMLQVRIDSGFPDVAFTELAIADLPQDEWGQVSVPLRDILAGGAGAFGGQPVNVNALASLITFEPTSAAHLRIDNLRLDCGGSAFCGIESRAVTPLAVFDEGVNDTTWTRGINGFDTEVGGDYTDGAAGNHVSWELVDTGEEGFGVVIETTFDASGASGVSFIGSEQPVDLSAWAEGELAFDIRVLSNPNDHPMIYKVDNPGGLGTGDQSLGLLPVGEWVNVRIPVSGLVTRGLDISQVVSFVLFPTFGGQDVVFQWDNVRFEAEISAQPQAITVPVDFEAPPTSYNFVNFEGGNTSIGPNPSVDALNGSATVATMQKFAGATFAGSVLQLSAPVDFSGGEVFNIKVFSSRPAAITFKLEGLAIEEVVSTAGTGWEVLTFDFSGRTGATDVSGVTFIVDNGIAGDAANDPNNWTFHFDDIEIVGGPSGGGDPVTDPGGGDSTAPLTTDFEGATVTFGNFEGGVASVVVNPVAEGINTSDQVGQMKKFAGATFAGSTLILDEPTGFAAGEAYTMKVWSQRPVPVLFKLEGVNQEVTANHGGSGWESMCFDFTGVTGGGSTTGITLIFDNGTVGAAETDSDNWTFYFDDITLGQSCGGTDEEIAESDPVLPVDFEGDASDFIFLDGGGFAGGQASVGVNPDMDGNTSAQVAQMLKFDGDVFGGATLALGGTFNLPSGSAFTMNVWSQRAVPVLFKLEGGPAGEVSVNHGGTGWEQLCFDFTTVSGDGVDGITFIFDLGTNGAAATDPDNWTFYFDDIALTNGCGGDVAGSEVFGADEVNFETPATGASFGWTVFENDDNPALEIVANPDTGGINSSATAGRFTARANGQFFAGLETAHGDIGPITLDASNSIIKVMVYKDVISDVGVKLAIANGGAQSEVLVSNTLTGQWEELTFDLSGYIGLPESIDVDQLILFPDYQDRSVDNIVLFDNVRFTDGS